MKKVLIIIGRVVWYIVCIFLLLIGRALLSSKEHLVTGIIMLIISFFLIASPFLYKRVFKSLAMKKALIIISLVMWYIICLFILSLGLAIISDEENHIAGIIMITISLFLITASFLYIIIFKPKSERQKRNTHAAKPESSLPDITKSTKNIILLKSPIFGDMTKCEIKVFQAVLIFIFTALLTCFSLGFISLMVLLGLPLLIVSLIEVNQERKSDVPREMKRPPIKQPYIKTIKVLEMQKSENETPVITKYTLLITWKDNSTTTVNCSSDSFEFRCLEPYINKVANNKPSNTESKEEPLSAPTRIKNVPFFYDTYEDDEDEDDDDDDEDDDEPFSDEELDTFDLMDGD